MKVLVLGGTGEARALAERRTRSLVRSCGWTTSTGRAKRRRHTAYGRLSRRDASKLQVVVSVDAAVAAVDALAGGSGPGRLAN